MDVKCVWELGRQQYLVELARGWLFAGDERYAVRARELMLDWIGANPLYEGVHWTSALEVAVRAISWLWTVATLATWDGWQPDDMPQIAASLAEHARYLEHHFSLYSSPYNHLVGEATGLYLIALSLPGSRDAARWRRLARKVLAEHGPRQFYGDGFCVEQATGYHFFTLGFLSMAIVAARREQQPLEGLEAAVHQAYRAAAALQQPDGRWPAIGDVDSARSIPVHHDDFWDFCSLVSLGAVLFDDPGLKACCDSPGEEVYWLLGCEGVARWHRLGESEKGTGPFCAKHPSGRSGKRVLSPSRSFAEQPGRYAVLPESGYAVARRGGDWLLFDAGPIAEGLHPDATPSTAHGHADALQVLYCTGGKAALVDCGMPFYYGSPDWVRHFRGPAAHNTLEIDGAPMVRDAGGLDWSFAPARARLEANLSEEAWLARGSVRWRAGGKRGPEVYVERHLLGLPGLGLWIADWIETDRPRRVRWFWQMPAGTVRDVSNDGPLACHAEGEDITLTLWSGGVPIRARLETPREDRPEGWNALGYGVWREGQRLCHESEAATRLLAVAYLGPSPVPAEVVLRGQRVLCTVGVSGEQPFDPDAIAVQDREGNEITWRIATESGIFTYSAGEASVAGESKSTPLHGVGGWPARLSFRLAGSTSPPEPVADTL